MCYFPSKQNTHFPLYCGLNNHPWPSKIHYRQIRLSLLKRRRAQLKDARHRRKMIMVKAEIEIRNLKLYIENQSIIEENDKLRKQAMLLYKENQTLFSQLQKKLSEQNNKTSH